MILGHDGIPYRVFLNLFVTWCKRRRLLRLGRLVWARGGGPATRGGYSAQLSLALRPKLIGWRFDWNDWELTVFGCRLHHVKSFGGWIT